MSGNDVTSSMTVLRGLAVPDLSITDDTFPGADTAVSQAEPWAGEPQAGQATSMAMEAQGAQTAGTILTVTVQDGGMPGTVKARHKLSTEGSTDWRGDDYPIIPHGYHPIQWDLGIGTYHGAKYPRAVSLDDGTILVAVRHTGALLSSTGNVFVYRSTDGGATASRVQVSNYGSAMGTGRDTHPVLVPLPSSDVLCFAWYQLSSGNMQIRAWISRDSGATWSKASSYCLPAALEYNAAGVGATGYSEFREFDAAYKDGQILLFACMLLADTTTTGNPTRDILIQYASADLGVSFSQVAITDTADGERNGRYLSIVASGGRFHVFWANFRSSYSTNLARTYYIALGSAYEGINGITPVRIPDVTGYRYAPAYGDTSGTYAIITEGYLSATVDEHGTLYVYQASSGASGGDTLEGIVMRSRDNGSSWEWMGQTNAISSDGAHEAAGTWWTCNDRAHHPNWLSVCWHRGRALAFFNMVTTAGTYDDSLLCMPLGGTANETMPDDLGVLDTSTQTVSPQRNWIGVEEPDTMAGLTVTTAGTYSRTITSGGWDISTTAGKCYMEETFTATVAEGIILRAVVDTEDSGSAAGDYSAIRLRLADSTDDYDVSLRFSVDLITVIDNNDSGATVGTITIDSGVTTHLHIAMAGSTVRIRAMAYDGGVDLLWVGSVEYSSLVSDTGTPDSTNHLSAGCIDLGTANAVWYQLWYCAGVYTGEQMTAFDNPTDLRGKTLSGEWAYVQAGVSVRVKDGPGLVDDYWTITTAYQMALRNLMPSVHPSPQVGWEATDETQQVITWDRSASIAKAMKPLTDVLVIGFYGFNIRTGTIYYQTTAGSYTSLGAFDAAKGYHLDYTRSGDAIVPASGSNDRPFFYDHMLAGWTINLGSSKLRRVRTNGGGAWRTASARVASIQMDGMDGTEPAGGTAYLYPPNFVLAISLEGVGYRAIKVEIDAQDTPDGVIKGGTLFGGHALFWGEQYGKARDITIEVGNDVATSEDGIDAVRVTSEPRRTISFTWDGVYLGPSQTVGAQPDYFKVSDTGSGIAVGNKSVTVQQMAWLYRYLQGRKRVGIYLPYLAPFTASTLLQVVNHPDHHMLCTMTSPGRIESRNGQEAVNEFARSGQVVLREVL